MATYTSNYGWTKPSGSDNVDISVLNNNLDDQDSTIHNAFLNMAPPFSESSTYAVDDIVLYGTGLYKCHTPVVTPGSWTGSTNWQVYKLSEGGGGGGTSDYTDLTNKPQINGVTLSGNKTSANLNLQNASTEITWAQWIQKTPQEQESGDWRITDCPWADGTISIDLMTKLWENPSPTSSFAAQNITLASDDYDYLLAIGYLSTGSLRTVSAIMKKGSHGFMSSMLQSVAYSRNINRTSDTELAVQGGYNGTTADNSVMIPYIIYGIKTTASVKINAIAMDVSTSADKCMLSDGVTSVEDRLENPLAVDSVTGYSNYQHITLMSSGTATSESITLTDDCIIIAVVTGAGTHSVYYGKPTASTIMLYPSSGQTDITMMALSKNTVITGNASGNGSCVSVVAIPLAKLLKLGS